MVQEDSPQDKCPACEASQSALAEAQDKLQLLEDLVKSSLRNFQKKLDKANVTIKKQSQRITELEKELESAKKKPFRRKSERRKPSGSQTTQLTEEQKQAQKAKRVEGRKRAAKLKKKAKESLPVESEVVLEPTPEQCVCQYCGDTEFKNMATSREIEIIDTKLAKLHLKKTKLQKKRCRCGKTFAEPSFQGRALPQSEYGPNLVSEIIVSKLLQSIPFYRQEQHYERLGFRIPNTTLCSLFHQAAKLCQPIYDRLTEVINRSYLVHADETTMVYLARSEDNGESQRRGSFRGYFWAFLAPEEKTVCFQFAEGRSADEASNFLQDSKAGVLVCDQYSGYNECTLGENKRRRAGCHAHARRKFKELDSSYPEIVKLILDQYAIVYNVEKQAKRLGFYGSPKHLSWRQEKSAAALKKIESECLRYVSIEKDRKILVPGHELTEKNPLIEAMAYFLRHIANFREFLQDARIPVDNNDLERLIRTVALLRKNSLFVKKKESGQGTAILLSLAMTCELVGLNPLEYFADILVKLTHGGFTKDNCEELLPQNWKVPKKPPKLASVS